MKEGTRNANRKCPPPHPVMGGPHIPPHLLGGASPGSLTAQVTAKAGREAGRRKLGGVLCSCFCPSLVRSLTHSAGTRQTWLWPLQFTDEDTGGGLWCQVWPGLQLTFLGRPGQVHRPDAHGHP